MTFNANWSRASGESRTEDYRTWRTGLGFGAVGDVDQLEYCGADGKPILAIELCVADRRSPVCPAGVADGQPPSPRFLERVLEKVSRERAQGRMARHVTQTLDIPLLVVVYIGGDLERGVWVKRIDVEKPWEALTLAEYERRLQKMHRREA